MNETYSSAVGGSDPGYSADNPGIENQPASQDSGFFDAQNSEDQVPSGEGKSHELPANHLLNDGPSEQMPSESNPGDQEGFVKLPGEDASDEDFDAFYEALGVPDNPEGYELKIPKDYEGIQSGEEWKGYTDAISELSHALGLSPTQAQALAELDLQAKTQSMENMEREQEQYLSQQIEDTTSELRDEWGSKIDVNVRTANRALKAFGGSELEGVLNEAGVLNDPVVIRAFHKAGLSLVEDSSPGGAGATKRNKSAAEILYPSSTKEG